MTLAAVFGLSGAQLTQDEADFFRAARPTGYILFSRNIEGPEETGRLVKQLRALNPDGPNLILIDQEGGRVQRLGPPHWRKYEPAATFPRVWEKVGGASARRGAWLQGRLIALDLHRLGINVNCAPCLDIRRAETHAVIGDRAFGDNPEMVSFLGEAFAEGLLAGGVLPVIKHMPGHGRALADSHETLPEVGLGAADLQEDFQPFANLKHLPMGMSAHILYSALDPRNPATQSADIIQGVIREQIGFDGFLFSDDICMSALSGDAGHRARRSLEAGIDCVLHCNGDLEEMKLVAKEISNLNMSAEKRLKKALGRLKAPVGAKETMLRQELQIILQSLALNDDRQGK